jgi:hypothetical protein
VSTAIVTKYSTANTVPAPGALLDGELAYSFPSGNLFIGSNGTYEIIGGKHYVDILDNRSSLATPSTLVERNVIGDIFARQFTATDTVVPGFIGNLGGISDSANSLHVPIEIVFSGDVDGNVVTDLSSNVQINLNIANTSVVPGTYGNSTNIPLITVDSKGRITQVSNLTISVASQESANAAFEQANLATIIAQSAFETANASTPSFNQSAFDQANLAFEFANQISIIANTPSSIANIALDVSLDALRHASAAFNVANLDNFTSTTANAAFDAANISSSYANSAFSSANIAFILSNSAVTLANQVSGLFTSTQSIAANAEIVATRASDRTNSAFIHANSAYDFANTRFASAGGTISGNVYISGNLVVDGNVTYVATNELKIGDNLITLNADLGQLVSPTQDGGIEIERGSEPNSAIIWNETIDKWTFTNDGTSYSQIGSAAAESYANAAFSLSNTTFAISTQGSLSTNAAFSTANGSFARVNALVTTVATLNNYANQIFVLANTPSQVANLAYIHANAAFEAANSLSPEFNQASFDKANGAYDFANNTFLHANAAFNLANTFLITSTDIYARPHVNAAYNHANAAYANSNTVAIHANAAYYQTNTATIIALAAYAKANSIIDLASGQAAFDQANLATTISLQAYSQVNGVFNTVNTLIATSQDFYARPHVNAAFLHANAAYDLANTKFSSSGGSITGDVAITGNLIVQGSSATLSVPSLIVEDNIIDIAAETIGNPTAPAGIRVIRGDETPVQFRWDEVIDKWSFTNDGFSYSPVGSAAAEIYSNSAYTHANAAYVSQNTTGIYTNSAYTHANAAYVSQNTTGIYANAAYAHANTKFATAGGTISGDVLVSGNLTVSGQTVYANTQNILINDNIITLNAAINPFAQPQFDAGIEIDRGALSNVSLIWNETVDNWQYTVDGLNYYNISSASAESYANAAFLAQNTTGSYANSAYSQANIAYNTGVTSGVYANAAFNAANNLVLNSFDLYARPHSNSAYIHANSSYDLVNTTLQKASSAELYANAGFIQANLATQQSTTSGSYANSAYVQANTATTNAAAADQKASSAGSYANSAYVQANTSSQEAVTAGSYANSGYARANTAVTNAAVADQKAVSAGIYANGAFQVANTKFSSAGGTISGDVVITSNLTVQGNTAWFSVPHFIVQDGIIEVNVEQIGGTPTENAGLRAMRGDLSPVIILWNETTDSWQFTNDGTSYNNIASQSAEVYANAAFRSQNTTGSYANSAFDVANNALLTGGTISGGYANAAFQSANSAGVYANAAYAHANTKFASAGGTISGDTRITGRLTIDGQLNSHVPIIQLNSDIDQDASPSENAGLRVDRGISPNVSILWNEGNDYWSFTNDGSIFSPIGSAAAESYSNSAYIHANSSFTRANSSGDYANAAFNSQNTTGSYANSAYLSANTADQRAVTSGTYANAAYAEANTKFSSTGGTISGDLQISGNLIVIGNTVTHSANDFIVNDPIILLANNNPGNILDIGFVAHYIESSTTKHTGLVKDVSANLWYLFDNYEPHIQETNVLSPGHASFRVANLTANIITSVISVRGYDPISYSNVIYDLSNTVSVYANSAYLHANASYISQNTTGVYANSAYQAANTALDDALAFAIALG